MAQKFNYKYKVGDRVLYEGDKATIIALRDTGKTPYYNVEKDKEKGKIQYPAYEKELTPIKESKIRRLIEAANEPCTMGWKVYSYNPLEDNKLMNTSKAFDDIAMAQQHKREILEKNPCYIVEIIAESVRVKTTFGSGKKGVDNTYRDKKDAVDAIDKALDSEKGTKVVATVESSQKNEAIEYKHTLNDRNKAVEEYKELSRQIMMAGRAGTKPSDNMTKRSSELYKYLKDTEYLKNEAANIDVKNPGILEVPAGKNVEDLPQSHFEKLVDKKGYAKVIRALTNLEVWNKDKNKKLSSWASNMADKLKKKFRPENAQKNEAFRVEVKPTYLSKVDTKGMTKTFNTEKEAIAYHSKLEKTDDYKKGKISVELWSNNESFQKNEASDDEILKDLANELTQTYEVVSGSKYSVKAIYDGKNSIKVNMSRISKNFPIKKDFLLKLNDDKIELSLEGRNLGSIYKTMNTGALAGNFDRLMRDANWGPKYELDISSKDKSIMSKLNIKPMTQNISGDYVILYYIPNKGYGINIASNGKVDWWNLNNKEYSSLEEASAIAKDRYPNRQQYFVGKVGSHFYAESAQKNEDLQALEKHLLNVLSKEGEHTLKQLQDFENNGYSDKQISDCLKKLVSTGKIKSSFYGGSTRYKISESSQKNESLRDLNLDLADDTNAIIASADKIRQRFEYRTLQNQSYDEKQAEKIYLEIRRELEKAKKLIDACYNKIG